MEGHVRKTHAEHCGEFIFQLLMVPKLSKNPTNNTSDTPVSSSRHVLQRIAAGGMVGPGAYARTN